jgi:hypothetical protein
MTDENAVELSSVNGGGTENYASGDLVVIPEDTWVELRMDVLPIRVGTTFVGDEIRVYRNTNEASPSWELLLTKRFYRHVDTGFRPWWGDPDYDTTQFESAGWHAAINGGDSTERGNNDNLQNNYIFVSTFQMMVEAAFP